MACDLDAGENCGSETHRNAQKVDEIAGSKNRMTLATSTTLLKKMLESVVVMYFV